MYTLRFEVPALRPDVARFVSETEWKAAAANLIHKRHAYLPLRIRVSHNGKVIYAFERK